MLVQGEKISFRAGGLGRITLKRSSALNALNREMFQEVRRHLEEWENDPQVSFILLEAESEKAFCAGGDVKAVVERVQAGETDFGKEYFLAEYGVDYLLHCYQKPILCWAHGITMGGGMGLLAGASHRVVTETTLMAMPEISIGFFPDVGSGYFLNRLPSGVGLFLGLTGTRLRGTDAVAVGLADALIKHEDKPKVLTALGKVAWAELPAENFHKLSRVLAQFQLHEIQSQLAQALLLTGSRLEQFSAFSLLAEYLKGQIFDSPALEEGRGQLLRGSPLAARVIFEHQKRCRNKNLAEVLKLEWALAVRFCGEPDFLEGVRSLLIDKDKSPGWRHSWSAEIPASEWQSLMAPIAPNPMMTEVSGRQPRAT